MLWLAPLFKCFLINILLNMSEQEKKRQKNQTQTLNSWFHGMF